MAEEINSTRCQKWLLILTYMKSVALPEQYYPLFYIRGKRGGAPRYNEKDKSVQVCKKAGGGGCQKDRRGGDEETVRNN